MGFSFGIKSSNSVGLAPLMPVFLFMTCCAASGDYVAAAPNLKVVNNLKDDALMVMPLPGCCSLCGPNPPKGMVCPAVCVQCGDVVVAAGSVGTLDSHVGPYPLPYLAIQVKEKLWCVEESALKSIKPWDTLAVGPGGCGTHKGGLEGFVRVRNGEMPLDVRFCLHRCSDDF